MKLRVMIDIDVDDGTARSTAVRVLVGKTWDEPRHWREALVSTTEGRLHGFVGETGAITAVIADVSAQLALVDLAGLIRIGRDHGQTVSELDPP